jgi:hypothetical protein
MFLAIQRTLQTFKKLGVTQTFNFAFRMRNQIFLSLRSIVHSLSTYWAVAGACLKYERRNIHNNNHNNKNSIEYRSSWEDSIRSAVLGTWRLLRNLNVCYGVHRIPSSRPRVTFRNFLVVYNEGSLASSCMTTPVRLSADVYWILPKILSISRRFHLHP